MRYINLTPRWTEILPTWLMMFEQAITGDCTDPDLIRENAKAEFRRMAQGADNYNDLVSYLHHTQGWKDDRIKQALSAGREHNEIERTTERGEDHPHA